MSRVKLSPEEEKQIKNVMGICWAAVEYDCASQYKNQNIPISHAVGIVLDFFHPSRFEGWAKLDPAVYSKFEQLSNTAKSKLARSVL